MTFIWVIERKTISPVIWQSSSDDWVTDLWQRSRHANKEAYCYLQYPVLHYSVKPYSLLPVLRFDVFYESYKLPSLSNRYPQWTDLCAGRVVNQHHNWSYSRVVQPFMNKTETESFPCSKRFADMVNLMLLLLENL